MTKIRYKLLRCSWGLLLLTFFTSCLKQTNGAEEIIGKAGNIIEQQPDSTLKILKSILFPEDLDKNTFNKYNLLLVQAKDKCWQDITGDTVIFAVRDYYIHKKDDRNAALAAFYCARLLHEQKEEEKAFKAYSTAIEWATKIEDYNLMGLVQGNLGILYYEYSLYEEAITTNKKAVTMYKKAKNYKNEISALGLIGDCYVLEDKVDSAFLYYDESLKMSDHYKISELQSAIRQSEGVAYRENENYESAKRMFREALSFAPDSIEQARIIMNLAKVYINENLTDSAKYYLNQALTISHNDPKLLRFSYFLLSKTEETDKHYQQALNYYKKYYDYTSKVFDNEKNNKLLEIQQKYDFEKLKNTKNTLIIKQKETLLTLSFVLLTTCIIVLAFYRKSIQNRRLLLEAEYKIMGLQKMANEFSEEKQSFRVTILQYFDILRKAALIEKHMSEDERKSGQRLLKKFNKIVYDQDDMDWDKLFQVINQFKNGFYIKIRKKYPQLTDLEFRVCCLSCENSFDDMEIAIITKKSINMVRRIRSDIRKKLGMTVYGQDLYSFLLQELSSEK